MGLTRNMSWRLGILAGVLIVASAAMAATPATMLEEGIYAEQTRGDLNEAISIYQRIVDNDKATRPTVSEALFRLGSCQLKQGNHQGAGVSFRQLAGLYPERKDLIERADADLTGYYAGHPTATPSVHPVTMPDPAALMPPETILYAEIGSPGKQVETLLRMLQGTPLANPLAVMQSGGSGGGGANRVISALLNPSMIKEFRKIRGFAIGVQEMGINGQPSLVATLYPGESDALRGILMAGLMMTGQPSEPIEGMQVVQLPGGFTAAMDDSVIIVANPVERLTWCVRQYKGLISEPTLASTSASFAKLDRQNRLQDALTVWVDGARTAARVKQMTGGSIEFAIADLFVDFKNIESVTARVVLDQTNPFIEGALNLREGHQNLAYGLIRTPNLTGGGFAAVPADAIALASFALSEASNQNAAQIEAMQRAVSLTGLDIGREIFANIEQVTLFAVPMTKADAQSVWVDQIFPPVLMLGLAITSRNPVQTRGLLDAALSRADAAIRLNASEGYEHTEAADVDGVKRYVATIVRRGPGPRREGYIYLGQAGRSTILSLNPRIAAAAVAAAKNGNGAVRSGPLAPQLSSLPAGTSKLLLVNAGGGVGFAQFVMEAEGQSTNRLVEASRQLAEGLAATNVQYATQETANRFAIRAGIDNLPSLGDLFPVIMEYQQAYTEAEQQARRRRAQENYGEWMGMWRGTIEGRTAEDADAPVEVRISYDSAYSARVDVSGLRSMRRTRFLSPRPGNMNGRSCSMLRAGSLKMGLIDGEIHLEDASRRDKGAVKARLQRVGDSSYPAYTPRRRQFAGSASPKAVLPPVVPVKAADVVGEWVGGVVDEDHRDRDKLLRLTITHGYGSPYNLRITHHGQLLRGPYNAVASLDKPEWVTKPTYHTGASTRVYLQHINGEFRGSLRIGGRDGERVELLLRRPGAPAATARPASGDPYGGGGAPAE